MLDIEAVGAIAPQANIAVYFGPNTDAGFLDAITTAIHDTTNKPSVISISWGGPESSWTQQSLTAFDSAFQAAAAMGITVCVASGDNGSSDGVQDGADHVDFPASSPHVLACGGTSLKVSGKRNPRRDRLERWRARGRGRRWRQPRLRAAHLARWVKSDADVGKDPGAEQTRRARCERRRGPTDRMGRADRWDRTPSLVAPARWHLCGPPSSRASTPQEATIPSASSIRSCMHHPRS